MNHTEAQTLLYALRRYREGTSIASRCWDFARDLKSATLYPLREDEFRALETKCTELLQVQGTAPIKESNTRGDNRPQMKQPVAKLASHNPQEPEYDLGGEG